MEGRTALTKIEAARVELREQRDHARDQTTLGNGEMLDLDEQLLIIEGRGPLIHAVHDPVVASQFLQTQAAQAFC
jgi:hypothetical protein